MSSILLADFSGSGVTSYPSRDMPDTLPFGTDRMRIAMYLFTAPARRPSLAGKRLSGHER